MEASSPPFLTDDEVAAICEPLVSPAAQVRYLAGLGLLVKRKPNGRPLVARSEFDRVLGAGRFQQPANAGPARAEPDMGALLRVITGSRRGKTPQAA